MDLPPPNSGGWEPSRDRSGTPWTTKLLNRIPTPPPEIPIPVETWGASPTKS
jgi:hypothetical protein